MTGRTLSPLTGALLGLLQDKPQSGYELRKLFATTPMGNFSDSPGSIYPALKRLAHDGLIAGTVENAKSLRPRQVFHLTADGVARLRTWLSEPVSRVLPAEGFDLVLLRFVFMPASIGLPATARFLEELEHELTRTLAHLRAFHRANASHMPLTGALGLRAGIEDVAGRLRWARLAHRALRQPAAGRRPSRRK